MNFTTAAASRIEPGMTLVIDGQHHIVEAAAQHEDDGPIYVQAETVIGDMGERSFKFEADDQVTIIASATNA